MDTLDIARPSPLVLADKLISLAQTADRAGYIQCAEQLLMAAYGVLDGDVADHVMSASWDAREAKRLRALSRLN